MKLNIVLIIMGDGDKRFIDKFQELNKKYKNFVLLTPFSDVLEQRLLAAGDILPCASIYEPCGTGHMRGMRYGVVPVARKTGGLADTISDYDERKNSGTGFLYLDNSSEQLLFALKRAVKLFYENKKSWKELSLRDMTQSFTWEKSIEEYTFLYRKLLKRSDKKNK